MSMNEAVLPGIRKRTYSNPLPVSQAGGFGTDTSAVYPDPYVLKYNGEYYCYATGVDGIPVLHSKDLTEWTQLGCAYQHEQERHYWAPAVIYHNGTFYMYYSSMAAGEEDVHEQRMKVATAKHPAGPFDYQRTLYDTFSIDAHVVKDSAGAFYLFYSTNEVMGTDRSRPGTVILVDRLLDMLTPEGHPRLVVKPTLDEEIYEENRFGDGRNWHTIEGAFYLEAKGRGYIMYSGNAYTKPYYYIGYSVSREILSTGRWRQQEWTKYPDEHTYAPLLKRNENVEGVGHHSVVAAPNNVDQWVMYHGRDGLRTADPNREERQLRMDPLRWCGAELWVPGPSHTPQSAPALPALRDLFDGEQEELDTRWKVEQGAWSQHRGEAAQSRAQGSGKALSSNVFEHYIYELNVKWEPSHMGGIYGAYACYVDERNHLQVLLDAGQKKLIAIPTLNGVQGPQQSVTLGPDFAFACYHQLNIHKTGYLFEVRLDGVSVMTITHPLRRGSVGMATHFTSACFAGVAVTEHLELNERTQGEFMSLLEVTGQAAGAEGWRLSDGELLGAARGREEQQIQVKQPVAYESFRFQADLKLDAPGAEGYAGVSLASEDGGQSLRMVLDRGDRSARLETLHTRESDPADSTAYWSSRIELPSDFTWNQRHTVFMEKTDSTLTIMLDRIVIYEGTVWKAAAVPGLLCNIPTRFSAMTITRL